jgi:3-methyladenine DNA glycosylase AlkD
VTGIVLRLAGDPEAAIPKAISWVLREHTRTVPGLVAEFLDEQEAVLPAIAKRETRNKLRTGTKRG